MLTSHSDPQLPRPSAELLHAFADIPSAVISDCCDRLFAAGCRLRPMHKEGRLLGPAFTVLTRPGDNLMVHVALDRAQPGDVIVVDAGGDLTNSIIGELMAAYASTRGIAGLVINGAIRDSETIAAETLPVYAAGVTHRGPYKDGPGQMGVPISIDGMVIWPGDIIVGDTDGIVAVPLERAEAILKDCLVVMQGEADAKLAIAAGTWDRDWLKPYLSA